MKPALLIALLAVSSYAAPPMPEHGVLQEQLLTQPGGSKFLTKPQLLALSINAGAMAADIVTSRQAINRGGHEANPIMGGNTAVLFKVGEVALVTVISYQLYKHGHTRMARILPLLTAAPSGLAAYHNSTVR